ncbi:hypothetical protein WA158_001063 [Blastocystis sp. Blastoise]
MNLCCKSLFYLRKTIRSSYYRQISTSLQTIPKNRKVCIVYGFYGKDYYGNTYNFNKPAIENVLTNAIYNSGYYRSTNAWSPTRMKLIRSSRTDKGVSAMRLLMSTKLFVSDDLFDKYGHSSKIVNNINSWLPEEIRVFSCVRVPSSFSPREDAVYRIYNYYIPIIPLYKLGYVLDMTRLQSILNRFVGSHNFSNFTKLSAIHVQNKTGSGLSRNIYFFNVLGMTGSPESPYIHIQVAGNAFIYNQIRKMIGASLYAALNIWNEEYIYTAIYNPTIQRHMPLIPAGPLVLLSASYAGNRSIYMFEKEIERGKDKNIFLLSKEEDIQADMFFNIHLLPHILQENHDEEFVTFLQYHNINTYNQLLAKPNLTITEKKQIKLSIPSHIPDQKDFEDAILEMKNNPNYELYKIQSKYSYTYTLNLPSYSVTDYISFSRLFPYSLYNCLLHYFHLLPGTQVNNLRSYLGYSILEKKLPSTFSNEDLLRYIDESVGVTEAMREGQLLKENGFIKRMKGDGQLGIVIKNEKGKVLSDYL